MRTKHLLTGLVLPALFAACTAEDIVSQQKVAKVDLSNRPVVGNVTLKFGETESRGTIADRAFNAIDFVKGEDGFGARIIDAVKYPAFTPTAGYELDHASRKYEVTSYASSNYKYVNAGSSTWSTDALMIEGSYMFYYPYSEKNLAREACEVVLPMKQTVKPAEAEGYRNPIKDLYEGENPAIVGYTFLSATDQDATVSPTLQHIFAYPQITLTNNYAVNVNGELEAKEITITKILLSSSSFKEKGSINHKGLVKALRDFSMPGIAGTNMDESIPAGTWTAKTKTGEYAAATEDIVTWTNGTNDGKIEVTFEGGLTLAPESSYSFHIVAPAAVYNNSNSNAINMTVYLSNDRMFSTTEKAHVLTNLTFAAGKRYPTEEYNFPTNGTPSVKANPGTLATVEFTENDQVVDAKDPAEWIDDITEFEAFLKTIGDNTVTIKEVDKLSDVNEANEFVLTRNASGVASMKIDAAVIELMDKYLNSGAAEFYSRMQVEDAENAVALDKMTFNGGLEILGGEVEAIGITVESVNIKGGALTIPATSTSELGNVEVEGGELIAKVVKFESASAGANADAGTKGKVTLDLNNKTMGTRYTLIGGTLAISNGTQLNVGENAEGLKLGTIENEGVIYVNSNYTLAENVTLEQKGSVKFNGEKTLTNNGTINNYKDLVVVNNGTVNMKEASATLIEKGGEGDVYNNAKAYVKLPTNGAKQNVWYVWEQDVDVAALDAINYSTYAINSLEIKGKKLTLDAEWTGSGSTLTYTGANQYGLAKIDLVKLTTGSSIYAEGTQYVNMRNFIIEGNVTMSGWGVGGASSITTLYQATVNLAEGAKLTIDDVAVNGISNGEIKFQSVDNEGVETSGAKIVNNGFVTNAKRENNVEVTTGTGCSWN